MPRFNHAAAVALYRDGKRPSEISRAVGASVCGVILVLRREAGYRPSRKRPWTEAELGALGHASDEALASEFGRTAHAVAAMRRRRGITAARYS